MKMISLFSICPFFLPKHAGTHSPNDGPHAVAGNVAQIIAEGGRLQIAGRTFATAPRVWPPREKQSDPRLGGRGQNGGRLPGFWWYSAVRLIASGTEIRAVKPSSLS